MVGKIKGFVQNVVTEMKKVSWPTREQLQESTGVVLAVTAIITGFVYIVDIIVMQLLKLLF